VKVRHFSSLQLQNVQRIGGDTAAIVRQLASPGADICAVGGDFFPDLATSVQKLAPVAEKMPVVYAPGNIDFYSRGKPMEHMLAEARELAEKIGNIHVLYNTAVTLGGTRFLGTTLWTRIPEEMAARATKYSNDFNYISTAQGLWSVRQQNMEHDLAVDFLENELSASRSMPTVVVTHNIPHHSVNDPKFSDPRYRDQDMSAIFVADLDWMTDSPFAPDYWIAGTNIFTGEASLGRTTVVSNGRGHPTKSAGGITFENSEFDFDRTFETMPKQRPLPKVGM
jgi:hypothetical protein